MPDDLRATYSTRWTERWGLWLVPLLYVTVGAPFAVVVGDGWEDLPFFAIQGVVFTLFWAAFDKDRLATLEVDDTGISLCGPRRRLHVPWERMTSLRVRHRLGLRPVALDYERVREDTRARGETEEWRTGPPLSGEMRLDRWVRPWSGSAAEAAIRRYRPDLLPPAYEESSPMP